MTPGRERMAALRGRRSRQGLRQLTVWLDQDSVNRLEALRRPGEHDRDVVQRALQALAAEHNRAVEAEIRDLEARHRALHERVHAMFYETRLTPRQIAHQMNKAGVPVGVAGGRWTAFV